MPEWHAYHDRSSAQHQTEFDDLSGRGFRMISLSVYGNPVTPRYAAVWVKRPGPAVIAFHDKTGAQFQQLFDQHTANGFRPTILSGTGGGAGPTVLAGVFEAGNWDFFCLPGVSAAALQQQSNSLRAAGFALRWLSAYGGSVNPLYAGIWEANSRPVGWSVELGDDANTYQKKFDAYKSGRMRPECIAVDGSDRFGSVWYDDLIGEWFAFHGMTAAGYQQKFDEMKARGFMPIRVQAGGAWNKPRFAAVFARDDLRPARQWTVRGPAASGLQAFDTVVRNFMQANGARAAQLAVVRRGKLVYARAFTNAEAGFPITELKTVFRVASVSKTITATAALALIERGQLALNDRMQDMLNLQTPSGGAPSDADFGSIRVWHLLSHSSGLNNNVDSAPNPKVVATAFGAALPVTRTQYARFAATQTVTNPGPVVVYQSYPYFLLGQVIAAQSGAAYEEFVNQTLWAPLGVTRARVAPSLVQNGLPQEAWYQPATPGLGTSTMTGDEPLVPVQYGTQYTEIGAAMGGWALAAADYARLWASFDIGAHNPVMSPQTAQDMWTNPPGLNRADALRGWWLNAAGAGVQALGHNGGLQGTAAAIWRRTDGVSVVVIFNRDLNIDFFNGAQFGTQMNAAIGAITNWPTRDLFTYAGLKSICDDGWRWCNRCQVLFRVGGKSAVRCPAGPGGHSETGSGSYTLVHDLPAARGQWGWRRCQDCEALWFGAGGSTGSCPANPGGQHRAGTINYVLSLTEPATSPGERGWRWCSRCQALWFSGNFTTGVCAAGPGGHSAAGSADYLLLKF